MPKHKESYVEAVNNINIKMATVMAGGKIKLIKVRLDGNNKD